MTAEPLATLAEVKEYLDPQDPAHDALLTKLIARASRAVRSHTGRAFGLLAAPPEASLAERTYTLLRERFVYTDDPYRSVASVTDEGGNALPWSPQGEASPGIVTHPLVELHDFHSGTVKVSAQFGWEEIPEDVTQAVIATVSVWYRRDVAHFSTTFDLDQRRVERPEALPSAARGMLEPYVRPGVG